LVAARLTTSIHHEQISNDLLDEFLRLRTFQKSFCRKLINLARQRPVIWETRCLAVLMLEHQVLKLQPDDLDTFGWLFTELNLKTAGTLNRSLLKDGYSTIEPRQFAKELQQRLARLNRVHRNIRGTNTTDAALREFVAVSRSECKLTLARYLYTPREVVDRILKELETTDGVKDIDVMQPQFIDAETAHALKRLPDFEAAIVRLLCERQHTYWVGERTSSRLNSLVEYPLTTVVLVIKLPGSDIELEVKRVGRRGNNPFNVVFRRGKYKVPVPHRLDGGSMQWLLRYEERSAAKFHSIYRLVHGSDAPLPGYVSRTTVFSIPTRYGPVASFRYFNDPQIFGQRNFPEMRAAMKEATEALVKEEGENLPAVAGEMGVTAEFLSHVAPAQSIMTGTSSFRIDKLGLYLSAAGAQTYFNDWLRVSFTKADAKQFADTLLEEVLGVYEAPEVALVDYAGYVEAAFAVPANRTRADSIFLELVGQIAKVWGTLLAARGYSRGESFVARNVGLRSVWEQGQWKVKLVFMDHDALSLPELENGHFYAQTAMIAMLLDERHIWGRANPELFPVSLVGYLMSIYRIGSELETRAQALAEKELKAAYDKTHQAMLKDRRLRAFFSDVFMSRLFDWDEFVRGYLGGQSGKWKQQMKKMFAEKSYEKDAFEYYLQAAEQGRGLLERHAFLFSSTDYTD
jgi:hypothetical protein